MNKLNQLLTLLVLTVLPIIGNLMFLCLFPLLTISCIFSNNDDFNKSIDNFYNTIAKFDK